MMVLTCQVQSCLDGTKQNRLLVRLTSPAYTHKPSRFGGSRLLLRSLTGLTLVFWSCSEGSQLLVRGAADRHYRAPQAQSYLYSLYRFTLTHLGAGGSKQSVAADHWDKTILLCFVSVMATRGKRKHHLHMTVDCKTDTLLLHFHISPIFFSFLNHLRMKTNHMSAVHHTHAIFSTTTQNKYGIISIHQRHLRITK